MPLLERTPLTSPDPRIAARRAHRQTAADAFEVLAARRDIPPNLAVFREAVGKLDEHGKELLLTEAFGELLLRKPVSLSEHEDVMLRISIGVVVVLGPELWTTADSLTVRPEFADRMEYLSYNVGWCKGDVPRMVAHLAAGRLAVAFIDEGLPYADEAATFMALLPLNTISRARRLWLKFIHKRGVPVTRQVHWAVNAELRGSRSAGTAGHVEIKRVKQRLQHYIKQLPADDGRETLRQVLQADLADLEQPQGAWRGALLASPASALPVKPKLPGAQTPVVNVEPKPTQETVVDGLVWRRAAFYVECGLQTADDPRARKLARFVASYGGEMLPEPLPGTQGVAGGIYFRDSRTAAYLFRICLERINQGSLPRSRDEAR